MITGRVCVCVYVCRQAVRGQSAWLLGHPIGYPSTSLPSSHFLRRWRMRCLHYRRGRHARRGLRCSKRAHSHCLPPPPRRRVLSLPPRTALLLFSSSSFLSFFFLVFSRYLTYPMPRALPRNPTGKQQCTKREKQEGRGVVKQPWAGSCALSMPDFMLLYHT